MRPRRGGARARRWCPLLVFVLFVLVVTTFLPSSVVGQEEGEAATLPDEIGGNSTEAGPLVGNATTAEGGALPGEVSTNVTTDTTPSADDAGEGSVENEGAQQQPPEDDFGKLIGNITNSVNDAFNINNCSLLEGLGGCNEPISAADVGVSAIVNSVLGVTSFLAFGVLRTRIKVYRARLASPATTVKPPKLPEGGVMQIFSWIPPVLKMSDQALLASAGLDALMYSRFLMLCVQFFLPVSVLSCGVLLPIHFTAMGDGYNRCESTFENDDRLIRTTVSNMCVGDPLLWVHFIFVYIVLAWAMWLLQKHYVAYSSLRHHYIGIPQKPNRWFDRYIKEGGTIDELRSPSITVASNEDEFLSPTQPSECEELGAVTSPDPSARSLGQTGRKSSLKDIVLSISSWGDTAKAWFKPDKLLNHKGEEPEDLQVFTGSKLQNMSQDEVSNSLTMSRWNGVSDTNVIMTNMSIQDSAGYLPSPTLEEFDHTLNSQKSFAALKWWDIYTERGASGSKKNFEREVMVRPSVRHIKGVNAKQDGLIVSVNAAQYAVLVTDIPRDTLEVESARKSHSRNNSKENRYSLGKDEDFDALEGIDPGDDICGRVFKQIFPDSFKHVVPIYNFSEVTRLLLQWDRAAQRLEIYEALFELKGVRPTMKTGFLGLWGERVDAITHFKDVIEELDSDIKRARKRAKFSSERKASFVLFDNQIDAAVAAQSVLLPLDGTKFVTHRAPGPDNINWLTLFKSNKEKFLRRLLVLPIILIIMLLPAGFFSSAMAVVDSLFCTASTPVYWPWYCESQSAFQKLLKRLVTGWLPSLLVTLWQNVIVTRAFYMVSLVECVAFSLSGVDKRITSLYFYWDFFNIFLGSVLGAALFTMIGQAVSLDNVREIMEALGKGIVSSSTFLTNYVMLRALFLVPFKLFFPHPGLLGYVLRNALSVTFTGVGITRRQRFQAWEPKSFMYGREAGTSLLMTLIGVAYCSTSPITVAIVAIYFLGIFVVIRHHLLYVYARNYESGGELWPILFDRFVVMLVSLSYFAACQMITKQAWPQALVLFVTTPVICWKFWSICNKRYREVSENVPLDIGWRQPKAAVPPQMYIPSELRSQSVGWHPEQGKAWSGYGLPRWL
ncbi:calcium-dependent channel protein [Chloropicon primus]|nr:calcium-dependent channel protein [Chloropicon primus]